MARIAGTTLNRDLIIEERDPGLVTLIIDNGLDGNHRIEVEVGVLARSLITASPSFALGVGEIAQRAILAALASDQEIYSEE
jgi:hypothetical protein